MYSIIYYTMITALRDWLFAGLSLFLLILCGLSLFLGSTSLVEQQETSLVFMAGSIRMLLTIGLVLFVCFHVRRLYDHKEMEATLSRPLSRWQFLLSYWLGFALLALCLVLPIVAMVSLLSFHVKGLLLWGISLFFEALIIISFALLTSLILSSAVFSVLTCYAFYFLSRMMGFFLSSMPSHPSTSFVNTLSHQLLDGISMLLPRLDLFAKTSWLVHGIHYSYDYWLVPTESVMYIPFLLCITYLDFRKKQL